MKLMIKVRVNPKEDTLPNNLLTKWTRMLIASYSRSCFIQLEFNIETSNLRSRCPPLVLIINGIYYKEKNRAKNLILLHYRYSLRSHVSNSSTKWSLFLLNWGELITRGSRRTKNLKWLARRRERSIFKKMAWLRVKLRDFNNRWRLNWSLIVQLRVQKLSKAEEPILK